MSHSFPTRRSSDLEAIACENPYPARYFPELNFNQMVLKALFTGVALARIIGCDGRVTSELSRMAADYASLQPYDVHECPTNILIDATGKPAKAGKATAKDADRGKATLVRLHGVKGAQALLDQAVAEALAIIAPFGAKGMVLAEAARFAGRREG